jgi:hypothetical protein
MHASDVVEDELWSAADSPHVVANDLAIHADVEREP